MRRDFNQTLRLFDYRLPPDLIAQKPASPRDSARLLAYFRKDKKTAFGSFLNLPDYLPKNAVLVFNQTKVIPARLPVYKISGGKIQLLYLSRGKNFIEVLSNRPLATGLKLFFSLKDANGPHFTVQQKNQGIYRLKPGFNLANVNKIFQKFGLTPLPPYIKHSPLSEKQKRAAYQTMFAKTGESVAAPTASLHFTPRLLARLKQRGIKIKFVRLDVNLGTFAKLTEKHVAAGRLHQEKYFIGAATAKYLAAAKKQGRPIIAVGTTVIRTLETYGQTKKLSGSTDLFIRPGFKFKVIDGLITNFHVPKSSLMMLVSALTGREKLLTLYASAMKKGFRFFSFGDGMLIV